MADMPEIKVYEDMEGNQCTLLQLIKRHPEWAVSRIKEFDKQKQEAFTPGINPEYVWTNKAYQDAIEVNYKRGKQEATKNIRAVWEKWEEGENKEADWKMNYFEKDIWKAIKAEGINAGWINEK